MNRREAGAFARLVKSARRRRGWTQQELADAAFIGRRTVIRWERGEISEPEPAQLRAVIAALDLDPADVYRSLGWLSGQKREPTEEPRKLIPFSEAVERILALPGLTEEEKQQLVAQLLARTEAQRREVM